MKIIQKIQLFKQPAPSIYVTFQEGDALTFIEIEFNELAKYIELQAQQVATLAKYQVLTEGNGPYPGNPNLNSQDWPYASWDVSDVPGGGLPQGVPANIDVNVLGSATPGKLSTAIYNCTPSPGPGLAINAFTIAPSFFTVLLPVRGGSYFEQDYGVSANLLSQVSYYATGQTQIDPDPVTYWIVVVATLEPIAGTGSAVIFTARAYTLNMQLLNSSAQYINVMSVYGDQATVNPSGATYLRFPTDNAGMLSSSSTLPGNPAVAKTYSVNLRKGVTDYGPTLLQSGQFWAIELLAGWDGLPTGPDTIVINDVAP